MGDKTQIATVMLAAPVQRLGLGCGGHHAGHDAAGQRAVVWFGDHITRRVPIPGSCTSFLPAIFAALGLAALIGF